MQSTILTQQSVSQRTEDCKGSLQQQGKDTPSEIFLCSHLEKLKVKEKRAFKNNLHTSAGSKY